MLFTQPTSSNDINDKRFRGGRGWLGASQGLAAGLHLHHTEVDDGNSLPQQAMNPAKLLKDDRSKYKSLRPDLQISQIQKWLLKVLLSGSAVIVTALGLHLRFPSITLHIIHSVARLNIFGRFILRFPLTLLGRWFNSWSSQKKHDPVHINIHLG